MAGSRCDCGDGVFGPRHGRLQQTEGLGTAKPACRQLCVLLHPSLGDLPTCGCLLVASSEQGQHGLRPFRQFFAVSRFSLFGFFFFPQYSSKMYSSFRNVRSLCICPCVMMR